MPSTHLSSVLLMMIASLIHSSVADPARSACHTLRETFFFRERTGTCECHHGQDDSGTQEGFTVSCSAPGGVFPSSYQGRVVFHACTAVPSLELFYTIDSHNWTSVGSLKYAVAVDKTLELPEVPDFMLARLKPSQQRLISKYKFSLKFGASLSGSLDDTDLVMHADICGKLKNPFCAFGFCLTSEDPVECLPRPSAGPPLPHSERYRTHLLSPC